MPCQLICDKRNGRWTTLTIKFNYCYETKIFSKQLNITNECWDQKDYYIRQIKRKATYIVNIKINNKERKRHIISLVTYLHSR